MTSRPINDLGALLFAVMALAFAASAQAEESVVVLTNPGAVARDLDRSSLQAIFLMRTREWPDGTPIRVFVLPPNHPVHSQFAREKLGTYPYILQRGWDRLVFTGTGLGPQVVGDESDMMNKVAETKGAIGYVSSEAKQHGGVPARSPAQGGPDAVKH